MYENTTARAAASEKAQHEHKEHEEQPCAASSMADTRVFVQRVALAGAQALQMSSPVMAFIAPEDSWRAIVNEFLMVRPSLCLSHPSCSALLCVCMSSHGPSLTPAYVAA